jgi:transcriptional regulator with XRE-family HTH domain
MCFRASPKKPISLTQGRRFSGSCRVFVGQLSGSFRNRQRSLNCMIWVHQQPSKFMILKQIRLSRLLSQEQLAHMSGLSVRTIQRIESGHGPSLESLKCLASVLEVDVKTLTQDKFDMDKKSDVYRKFPTGLKWLFVLNFFSVRPTRTSALNVELASHFFGYIFCVFGLVSEPALVGGLILLANGYLFRFHIWLGDKYGAWYEKVGVGI